MFRARRRRHNDCRSRLVPVLEAVCSSFNLFVVMKSFTDVYLGELQSSYRVPNKDENIAQLGRCQGSAFTRNWNSGSKNLSFYGQYE